MRLNWVTSWHTPANLDPTCQQNNKKTIFSLPLSSSHLPHFSKNIEGLKQRRKNHNLFFFFITSSLLQNPLKELQILQRNPNKGDVHTPKPTINGTHNKIQWETHATNSDPPKKKRINPTVSTNNFTSILQYPSHKEQHRQQYH